MIEAPARPLRTPRTVPVFVREAADLWIDRQLRNDELKPKTHKWCRRWHVEVANRLGSHRVEDVTVDVLEDSSRVDTWSKSTRRGFFDVALAILRLGNWEPDRKIKKPRKASAGTKKVITELQHQQIVGRTRGDFREYIRVLWELGCRPGELAQLTVELVNWRDSIAILTDHKTAEATGRPRTLYFSARAMDSLNQQKRKYGSGLLFRNEDGETFTDQAIVRRFLRIAKSLEFPVTAYSYRHTFVTRCLLAGISSAQVAELTGTSIGMISRNYGHLEARPSLMREVISKLV